MLSGWETEAGYDFRGIVKGIMHSWFNCFSTAGVNGTLAIGVVPNTLVVATTQLTTTLKSYPWMYYRRIQTNSVPTVDSSLLLGSLAFDTNVRVSRRVRQAGDQLTLFYDNLGGTNHQITHWSNILLTS